MRQIGLFWNVQAAPLSQQVGWPNHAAISNAWLALQHSQHVVLLVAPEDQLAGLARATSDGVYNATIGDVVVLPEYQVRLCTGVSSVSNNQYAQLWICTVWLCNKQKFARMTLNPQFDVPGTRPWSKNGAASGMHITATRECGEHHHFRRPEWYVGMLISSMTIACLKHGQATLQRFGGPEVLSTCGAAVGFYESLGFEKGVSKLLAYPSLPC